MKTMRMAAAALSCLPALLGWSVASGLPLQQQTLSALGSQVDLQVPQGVRVEFVAALFKPRFIALGPDGELLIGSRKNSSSGDSTISRVPFPYRSVENLVSLPGFVHSVAYRQGVLYAAETSKVLQASYGGAASQLSPGDFTQVTPLPADTGGHSSRTIITGPGGDLYIGLGISRNCSDEYMDYGDFQLRRGGVFRFSPGAGTGLQTYSSGLRNPIGLAFQPGTGVLYATNAGPDDLGFDLPPEVLAALAQGSYHGMPWFQYYSGAFHPQNCISTVAPPRPSSEAVVPAATFLPRSTPQGIAFLTGSTLGDAYAGSAAVAIHGSWATPPGGGQESRRPPKLALVVFSGGTAQRVEDLVTGFQYADGNRFARPSGIAVASDGNIYFTSDGGDVEGLFRLVGQGDTGGGDTGGGDTGGGSISPFSSIYGLLLDGP